MGKIFWLLHNDDNSLTTVSPIIDSDQGFVGFLTLEEATLFLTHSSWPQRRVQKVNLDQLWVIYPLPVHIFTSNKLYVNIETLRKDT